MHFYCFLLYQIFKLLLQGNIFRIYFQCAFIHFSGFFNFSCFYVIISHVFDYLNLIRQKL